MQYWIKIKANCLVIFIMLCLIITVATNQVHGSDCHKQEGEIREMKWGKHVTGYFGIYKLMNSETFVILFVYFLLKARGERIKEHRRIKNTWNDKVPLWSVNKHLNKQRSYIFE